MKRFAFLAALVLVLGACAEGGSDETVQPVPESTPAQEPTSPADETEPTSPKQTPRSVPAEPIDEAPTPRIVGEVPGQFVTAVLADAAQRLSVEASSLEVLRSQAVVWNDGSLGCPEPGMSYTQALVDGYWMEVGSGERVLDYRLNDSGFFVLCAAGTPPAPNQ